MDPTPPLSADMWAQLPPVARDAVGELARAYRAALDARAAGWAVPAEPQAVVAALRAGERSWARFPYYARRFGDRGRTFTQRDSLWLAGLAGRPEDEIHAQVAWLGGVLAARGMPRWLLECHLAVLHEELTHLAPGGEAAGLLDAADRLRAERQRWMNDARLAELGEEFAAAVGPELAATLPEAGRLLAAAVADEKCGVVGSLTAIESWLVDKGRFPTIWIAAARATVRSAKHSAGR
jgi:hypothetical protein